jgi:hypothetical protein
MVPFNVINTSLFESTSIEVTAFQAKAALARAGYLNAINAHMNRSTTDPEDKLRWENATTFKRDHPLILKVAEELMLPPQVLDELFQVAKSIVL